MLIRIHTSPRKAALDAGVTPRCILGWCRRYPALARKVGGRWRIDPDALARLIAGGQP